MNQESKEKCYQKIYAALKEDENIVDLTYPKERENYDFSCKVGEIDVVYSLKANNDLLSIKAEKMYQDLTPEQLQEKGEELTDGYGIRFTHYDGKLILQSTLPVAGMTESEAVKKVDETARLFFEFLKVKILGINADIERLKMEKEPENSNDELPVLDEDNLGEIADLHNFSRENSRVEGKDVEIIKTEEKVTVIPNYLEEFLKKENIPFEITSGMTKGIYSVENLKVECSYKDQVLKLVMNVICDINERVLDRILNWYYVGQYSLIENGYTLYSETNIDSVDAVKQAITRFVDTKQDIFDKCKVELNKTAEVVQPHSHLNNDLFESKADDIIKTPSVLQDANREDKSVKKELFEDSLSIKDFSLVSKDNGVGKKISEASMSIKEFDVANENKMEDSIVEVSEKGYKRAPEIAEQMHHMYIEMDEIFESKKKQLDYREETLNRKEASIVLLKENAEFMKEEADKANAGIIKEKEELKNKWSHFHERKNKQEKRQDELNAREDELNEKELKLIRKEQSIKDKLDSIKGKELELSETVKKIDEKLEQLDKLKIHLKEQQDSLDLKISDSEKKEAELKLEKEKIAFREKQLSTKTEVLEAKSRSIEERAVYVENLEHEKMPIDVSGLKREIESLKNRNKDLLQAVEQSKLEYENACKMTNEAEQKLKVEIVTLKEKLKETSSQNLENSKSESKESISELKCLNEKLIEEKNDLLLKLNEQQSKKDPDYSVISAKEQLARAGIKVDIIPGDGDLILAGETQECTICVNESAHMVYIEKPVRRGIKYQKLLEEWNQENIKTSYLLAEKKIICKKVVDDGHLISDVQAIVSKLSNLK